MERRPELTRKRMLNLGMLQNVHERSSLSGHFLFAEGHAHGEFVLLVYFRASTEAPCEVGHGQSAFSSTKAHIPSSALPLLYS